MADVEHIPADPKPRPIVSCAYCGEKFEVPYRYGPPYSCGKAECEREVQAMERESSEQRREDAERDDYSRY